MAKNSQRSAGLKHGWRSGLEDAVGAQLAEAGIDHHYEELVIPFEQPVQPRKYTADFYLPNGIVIETKGRFLTADRKKHLMVKAQHPALDIRFVFSNPNTRISKQSATTYAKWCESKGFQYAKGSVPSSWMVEPTNLRSLMAIQMLVKEKKLK